MRFSAWDDISVADACGKTRDQAHMACRLYFSAQNDSTARHYLVNCHCFGGSECLTLLGDPSDSVVQPTFVKLVLERSPNSRPRHPVSRCARAWLWIYPELIYFHPKLWQDID